MTATHKAINTVLRNADVTARQRYSNKGNYKYFGLYRTSDRVYLTLDEVTQVLQQLQAALPSLKWDIRCGVCDMWVTQLECYSIRWLKM